MNRITIFKAFTGLFLFFSTPASAQMVWENVDSLFGPMPSGAHVYRSTTPIDGRPNIAYYFSANLNDPGLKFGVDTTLDRRLTPRDFYEKNKQPLLVVNTTFFSFASNRNLSTVVQNGQLVSYSPSVVKRQEKDSVSHFYITGSAFGISKNRTADVAWLYADSSLKYPRAFSYDPVFGQENKIVNGKQRLKYFRRFRTSDGRVKSRKWKMELAVGGGPVLIHNSRIRVTNNEEMKFVGKGLLDRHPRTAMGYCTDGRLIVLAVQGRSPGIGEGADLLQLATILKEIGCYEALNLDGGGSSCLLINGKETITPSDKEGQRPVPAVFIVR